MRNFRRFGHRIVLACVVFIFPSTAGAASRIELADAMKTFLLPASSDANIPSWTVGATADSSAAIVWKTKGLATDPHGVVMRHGSAVVAIDGKIEERLETRVVPVEWSINLYGPMAGPSIVDFNMGMLVRHDVPKIASYLRRHGFAATLVDCRGTGSDFYEALYRVTAPRYQPVSFFEYVSCGVVACMYRYELGFSGMNAIADFRDAEQLPQQPKGRCSRS